MHGGVIDAENAVELEWSLQGFGKLAVHAEEEIEQVARPHAIAGMDTIGPANRRVQSLLIVKIILRAFAHDVIVVAEHEQAAERGMQPAILTAYRRRANSTQKTLVIEIGPRTALTYRTETIAICPHCVCIEVGNSEIVQHLGIHRLSSLIPEHC